MQVIVLATSQEAFLAWGWRLAFLASALLVLVEMFVRLQVTETRDFVALSSRVTIRGAFPLKLLFARYWRPMLLCLLLQSGLLFGSYVLITFGAGYAQRALGIPANWIFIAGLVAAACNIPALFAMAWLSDRIGRKAIYAFGLVSYVILPLPFYFLLELKTLPALILASVLVWVCGQAGTTAVQSSFLAELFPTEVRYSAISVAYQLSSVVIGIPVSFIPVYLMEKFGTIYAVAVFGSLDGIIGLLALLRLPETFRNQTVAGA